MGIYVGTSGWSYDHWQDVLYPPGTPSARRLALYLQRFRTVEVNATYYHWQRDRTFAAWRALMPAGFLMSVKAPRGLTHARKLAGAEVWLPRMEPGLRALGPHLGVLLVQLSPRFERDDARLEDFLRQVPPWVRTAVEFRHPSWHCEEIYRLLEQHGAAYCVMSGAGLPCVLRATAPFVYLRLHGPDHHGLYSGSYSDDDLRWWAARCVEWVAQDRDVFAYFNNDQAGHAVRNAETLRALLSCE